MAFLRLTVLPNLTRDDNLFDPSLVGSLLFPVWGRLCFVVCNGAIIEVVGRGIYVREWESWAKALIALRPDAIHCSTEGFNPPPNGLWPPLTHLFRAPAEAPKTIGIRVGRGVTDEPVASSRGLRRSRSP